MIIDANGRVARSAGAGVETGFIYGGIGALASRRPAPTSAVAPGAECRAVLFSLNLPDWELHALRWRGGGGVRLYGCTWAGGGAARRVGSGFRCGRDEPLVASRLTLTADRCSRTTLSARSAYAQTREVRPQEVESFAVTNAYW